MTTKTKLTLEELKRLLDYDPVTGEMRWNIDRHPVKAGELAGCDNGLGYIVVTICGKRYRRSRLAWLYMTGLWPSKWIDHKDRNRSNDKWINLRESTCSQNSMNKTQPNRSLPKNVHYDKKYKNPYRVQVTVNRKLYHLGNFATVEEAEKVAIEKSKELHGEFSFHV